VTFSEFALANPSAWAFIRPMLEENGGWAAFITTPRFREPRPLKPARVTGPCPSLNKA
jgi:hypothetical protein